jgi:glycosyltransferase involved in cell wall biosynthesis
MVELKRRGVQFHVFSLKKPSTEDLNPEIMEKLEAEAIYRPFFWSSELIFAQIEAIILSPLRYFGCLGYILWHARTSLSTLTKSLAIFPKSVMYARIIKRSGIKNVHAHWATTSTTCAMIVSKMTRIPFTFTAHAWDIYADTTLLREKIKNAKVVVTCTGFNKEYMDNLMGDKTDSNIKTIYHGIDLDELPKVERQISRKDGLQILSVGLLWEKKGFLTLIKAVGLLKKRNLNVHCIIIGTPASTAYRDLLRNEISSGGLNDRVRLIEKYFPLEQILSFMAQSDIFVLPCLVQKDSIRDGIPNVLIEAMALKVPVISTNVSGIPELVESGKNGILVPSKDEKALADAIESVYHDPDLDRKLGEQGRDKVQTDFDIKKNAKQLEQILFR